MVRMVEDTDMKLICRECGKQFVFTIGEQEFYERKGLAAPTRCKECCSNRQKQPHHFTCSQCGIELGEEARIYCECCLKNVQIDYERRMKQHQKAASVAQARLQVTECRNAELEESLYQAKQLVAELELKVNNLTLDLDKASQFYIASRWLEPALKNMEQRLGALEQAQRESNQKLFDAIRAIQEAYESIGLLQIIKRSLTPNRKQSLVGNSP